jgi:hypothetical protein
MAPTMEELDPYRQCWMLMLDAGRVRLAFRRSLGRDGAFWASRDQRVRGRLRTDLWVTSFAVLIDRANSQ